MRYRFTVEKGREGERELVGGVLGNLLEVLLPTALVALEHLQEEIYRSCNANVYVLNLTVQFCAVMYSKVQFFTKLLNMGMLYVFSMVFGVKKLISELTSRLDLCTVQYCKILYHNVL